MPQGKAELHRQQALTNGRQLCSILVASGVRDLLGGSIEQRNRAGPEYLPVCEQMGLSGRVVALLVPASDKKSLQQERRGFLGDARNTIDDERELGAGAFSVASARARIYVAIKGETLLMLSIDPASAAPEQSRRFAKRVLNNL